MRIAGRRRRTGRDGVGRHRRDRHSGGRGGDAGRIGLPADVLGVWQFVVLFPFHAPILEPDFNLAFGQTQTVSDFDAPASRQVSIEMEFLFQFEDLVAGVGRPLSLRFHSGRESSVG